MTGRRPPFKRFVHQILRGTPRHSNPTDNNLTTRTRIWVASEVSVTRFTSDKALKRQELRKMAFLQEFLFRACVEPHPLRHPPLLPFPQLPCILTRKGMRCPG